MVDLFSLTTLAYFASIFPFTVAAFKINVAPVKASMLPLIIEPFKTQTALAGIFKLTFTILLFMVLEQVAAKPNVHDADKVPSSAKRL